MWLSSNLIRARDFLNTATTDLLLKITPPPPPKTPIVHTPKFPTGLPTFCLVEITSQTRSRLTMTTASRWPVPMGITLMLTMITNVQPTTVSVHLVSLSITLPPPPPTPQALTRPPSNAPPHLTIHPELSHTHLPPPPPPPIGHTHLHRRERPFIVDIPVAARTLLQLRKDIREHTCILLVDY